MVRKLILFCALLFIVFRFPFSGVNAQYDTPTPAATDVTVQQGESVTVTTTTEKKTVDYVLPYPGILPDHPLYVLKKLRDYILEKVIVDPVKKAEFYLLQADKRLAMGVVLVDQNKNTLAESTISKGEKYMEQSVSGLNAYKASGNYIPSYLVDRLEKAAAKHVELITELMTKVGDTEKQGLAVSLALVKSLQGEIIKLK